MRLSTKLAAALAAVLVGGLLVFQTAGTRAFYEEASARQDADIRRAVERLAEACGEAGVKSSECGHALWALTARSPGAPAADAAVFDDEARVAWHSDFLTGDSTLKGKHASSPHELAAVERRVPLRQDGVGGDDRRVYSAPAFKGKEFAGTALVSFRRADLERALDWIRDLERRRRWLALLLGASLALLGGLAISSWLLRPLGGLLEAARRVRAGDFAHRVEHPSSDELGVLAGEFNAMTARLGELDQLKADFVAQVTHDLRSPLSGILAQADILSGGYKGKLTEDQLECLRLLDRSGRDLAALVDNILDVTRLEAGETKLEPAPLDIRDAIEPMLDGFKARAEKLGVGLEAHIQPELSLVMADPEALRRVLENLLSNALKFTPKDGHVSVSARRDTPRECVVTVSDSGPGIPDFRMAQLFKKFSQIPETQSLSRGHAGSGLGLAICRKLVERMGGRIWAESEPGKGARFRFTLPLVLAREGGAYSK